MTNEEVVKQTHEKFALRGLFPHTEESYLCALRLFQRFHEDRPIETMGSRKSVTFCSIKPVSGKQTVV
ncbi:hypothetical protein [Ethanoligenens sp.]|uniref:hypothetical protein n=1 Tax=Ethanoligenens sp. TaxID=2099655 RepID=UPI0039E760DB